jgi:hypothetical protein
MPVLSGTTSGSIIGTAYRIPSLIQSFVLTNMTVGAITVNVSIIEEGTNNLVTIAPIEIAANDTYTSDVPILMKAGFTVYIVTSGELDYYFTITDPNK